MIAEEEKSLDTQHVNENDQTSSSFGIARRFQKRSRRIKITKVAWSICDKFAVLAYSNGSVRIWDIQSTTIIHTLRGHQREVYVLAIHTHDNRGILATASLDGHIVLWDIATGKEITRFSHPDRKLLDAQFSKDGSKLLVIDNGGSFSVYGCQVDKGHYSHGVTEQMFLSDYHPLRFNDNFLAVDDNTQLPPHLQPRSNICNFDGREYFYQKGKEYGTSLPAWTSDAEFTRHLTFLSFEDQKPYAEKLFEAEIAAPIDKKVLYKRRAAFVRDSDSESGHEELPTEPTLTADVGLINNMLIPDHSSDEDYVDEDNHSDGTHATSSTSQSINSSYSSDEEYSLDHSEPTSHSGNLFLAVNTSKSVRCSSLRKVHSTVSD
jgi:hypothetical protein